MESNEESLRFLYSILTTFFTFDIFKKFFSEKINGEDGEISYTRSGDGEDEERGMGNGERGMGCWRLEMANTNDNFDTSIELKRGDAKI